MPLPNFFVIGSSRSGTTSLYHHFRQHPQIYVTRVFEPRFFAFEGSSLEFSGPGDELLKKRIVTNLEDYVVLFKDVTDETAIGEVSPAYLSSELAPTRIRHYIPDAKIIAILRNPVERAISSFRFEVLEGLELAPNLETALIREEIRMSNNWSYVYQYRRRGFYYTHMKRYFDIFPHSQIKVFLYEDWQDEVEFLKGVYRFLGVDEAPAMVQNSIRVNSSDAFRFKARGVLQPEFSRALRARLTAEYREEMEKLQELINRDLSKWLQVNV